MSDEHQHGALRLGGVIVPTAIVCALISAGTNLLMREPHAAASGPSPAEVAAMRDDIRELRSDVKAMLTRMGALEDGVHNINAIRDAAR